MPSVLIERIDRTFGDTIQCMTADHWRADNILGGLPALVHVPACIHSDLEYTICARNKRRRAGCGCPAIGVAHVLYIDLSADTSECVRMQDISLAGFACREDEIVREEH